MADGQNYYLTEGNFADILRLDHSRAFWRGLLSAFSGVAFVEIALWFLFFAGGIKATTLWFSVHTPLGLGAVIVVTLSLTKLRKLSKERDQLFNQIEEQSALVREGLQA